MNLIAIVILGGGGLTVLFLVIFAIALALHLAEKSRNNAHPPQEGDG